MELRNHFDEDGNSIQGIVQDDRLIIQCHKVKKTLRVQEGILLSEISLEAAHHIRRLQVECITIQQLDSILVSCLMILAEVIQPPPINGEFMTPRKNNQCDVSCDIRFGFVVFLQKIRAGAPTEECLSFKFP